MLGLLTQVDKNLAAKVAGGLGLTLPEAPEKPMNRGVPADAEAGVITDGNADKFIRCIANHRFWNREELRKVPS